MMGLLKNAWEGWMDFRGASKLAALLILAMLLCVMLSLEGERHRKLLLYCLIITPVCVFPLTAACIMGYQTRFYDYQWIWTLVPMTAMIACGEALLLRGCFRKFGEKSRTTLFLAGGILLLNLLSGSLWDSGWKVEDQTAERKMAAQVVSELKEKGGEICLWAPREVIDYARAADGDIRLLYGRNLYQKHLDAYSYDTYPEEMYELYAWMIMAERYGTVKVPVEGDVAAEVEGLHLGDTLDGIVCARRALGYGVNRILLPGNMAPEAVDAMAQALSLQCTEITGYYLLMSDESLTK